MAPRLNVLVTVSALAAAASGCALSSEDASRFREPIPQASEVEVSGPDGATSGTGASSSTLSSGDEPWAQGPWAKYYGFTRHVRNGVNGVTAVILGGVWLVVHTEPSDIDDKQAVWGPWDDSLSPASYRFRVEEKDEREYEYTLEGRPKTSSSDADWRAVLSGTGYGRRHDKHGDGSFSIDLDVAGELDPFEHADDSGTVTITHQLSTPDRKVEASVKPTATDQWWTAASLRHPDGSGTLLVNAHDDVDDTNATALEDIVIDSRWRTDGAGRADITISGGDVGEIVVTASECWGTDFMRSYYSDSMSFAPTEGDATACAMQ